MQYPTAVINPTPLLSIQEAYAVIYHTVPNAYESNVLKIIERNRKNVFELNLCDINDTNIAHGIKDKMYPPVGPHIALIPEPNPEKTGIPIIPNATYRETDVIAILGLNNADIVNIANVCIVKLMINGIVNQAHAVITATFMAIAVMLCMATAFF